MTKYQNGQRVRSLTSAQGLAQAAEYTVVDVQVRSTFVGRFTSLVVESATGARVSVGNPHLVLEVGAVMAARKPQPKLPRALWIRPRALWIRSERVDIELDVRSWAKGAFLIVGIGGACENCGRELAETGSLRVACGTLVACGCGHTFEIEVHDGLVRF